MQDFGTGQLFIIITDNLAEMFRQGAVRTADSRAQAVRDNVDKGGIDPGTVA
jgi:hypothetical protein